MILCVGCFSVKGDAIAFSPIKDVKTGELMIPALHHFWADHFDFDFRPVALPSLCRKDMNYFCLVAGRPYSAE